MTFNEALRAAIAREGFGHLTLAFTHDGQWQAAFKPKGASAYRVVIFLDPEIALIAALTDISPRKIIYDPEIEDLV